MEGIFDVTLGGQIVGTVEVRREGLYCILRCRCRMVDSEVHRLCADDERLGVLVPERGELVLETKVAAKRLKPGCCFTLDEQRGEFIPIRPGEAFGHLDKVRLSKLVFREGERGIYLG